jgi:hypothetical protein
VRTRRIMALPQDLLAGLWTGSVRFGGCPPEYTTAAMSLVPSFSTPSVRRTRTRWLSPTWVVLALLSAFHCGMYPKARDDEKALTAAIASFARTFGRCGYRLITALALHVGGLSARRRMQYGGIRRD